MGVGDHHACWALVEVGPPHRRPPRVPVPLRLLPRGGRRRLPRAPGSAQEGNKHKSTQLPVPASHGAGASSLSKLFRFLQLLVSLVRSYRCGTERVDEDVATSEAGGGTARRSHQEEKAAARRRGGTDRQHEEQAPAAGHVQAVQARPRHRRR
jgi:hypothetical protein